MKILGLTGGIASGKTTVSTYLKEMGYPIIDADKVSRKVVEPHTEGLKEISHFFGNDILQSNGSLNRKKLGEIVFENKDKRELLNKILSKKIRTEIINQIEYYKKQGADVLILDIPLLFEGGYDKMCDFTMVIYIPKELQIERLIQRDGLTRDKALKRISAQLDSAERNSKADIVIDNSRSIKDTHNQVIEWLERNNLMLEK
ncbi:dephospho-CoA kinase [Ligilactobacillus salivarius]|uniref:dephospho-CoA kinase n=1 Tax=Ligilactobacillus salivarius TaxID=1624 RepID=UPI002151A489|nr:dephospho-CoA kinase [Ligilactobacillus salivarius]MDH4960804.1 dephospho-CoA kinase [Ligilactobacillus salivarius]UUY23837.1 dephospho-CoA kinase [Ligilactobacillus salivarius]